MTSTVIYVLFFILGGLIGYLLGYYLRMSHYARQIEILIREVQAQEQQVRKLVIAIQRANYTKHKHG